MRRGDISETERTSVYAARTQKLRKLSMYSIALLLCVLRLPPQIESGDLGMTEVPAQISKA